MILNKEELKVITGGNTIFETTQFWDSQLAHINDISFIGDKPVIDIRQSIARYRNKIEDTRMMIAKTKVKSENYTNNALHRARLVDFTFSLNHDIKILEMYKEVAKYFKNIEEIKIDIL